MTDSRTNPDPQSADDKKSAKRRIGSEKSATRITILEATEKLMLDEGYASVTSRRVAKEIDVKPSLIHYYFPTTDDLFLQLYRHMLAEKFDELAVDNEPVESALALWQLYQSRARTALALEFMALANHRKVIRDEIARHTEIIRKRRAELLSHMVDADALAAAGTDAAGLSVLLIGVARTLVMEENLGVTTGHQGARTFIERLLKSLSE